MLKREILVQCISRNISFRGPMHIYDNIKNVNTSIEKKEEHQKQFKLNLKKIVTENSKHK